MVKTQTAVEWLVEQYIEKLTITPDIVKQALDMEKEQIIIAYQSERYPCSDADAEDYYNITFKND